MEATVVSRQADRSRLPLAGLKVLDLTQFVAGPYCTLLLADLGAEVYKIELPGKGDAYREAGPYFVEDQSSLFLSLNRNKKSVAIDFRKPAGRELVWRLVGMVDVLVENSRPGALQRYGLGYDDVRPLNERLVYCSITGYGQSGPLSHLGGFDLILQGIGGLMSVTGEQGRPPVKVGLPVLDTGAAILAAFAIVSAIHGGRQTGRGRHVDVSLLDFSLACLTTVASSYFAGGVVPDRRGSASSNFAPYQAFATADGWITVCGSGSEEMWRRLCRALELEELETDSRFESNSKRVANEAALIDILAPLFVERTKAEWLTILEQHGVPAGPINTVDEVLSDPQVMDRNLIVEPERGRTPIPLVGTPLRFVGEEHREHDAPPALGEHTGEVLLAAGLSKDELSALCKEGVIA
jgi:crotonobetainyl-CoA:carnitine CoA-transferase CaiB-like acyl-CoA transferase